MPSPLQQVREATDRVVGSLAARVSAAAAADDVSEARDTSDASEDTGVAGVSGVPAASIVALMTELSDAALTTLVRDAAAARAEIDTIVTIGAGLIAKRSERELGYAGLAAREGHRSPIGLVQSLTGSTRGDASRQVRLGEAIGEADAAQHLIEAAESAADPGADPGVDQAGVEAPVAELPWFEPITCAVTSGVLTAQGGEALLRGLGQSSEACDPDVLREAALELLTDAAGANADELAKRARWLRDRLDPAGVIARSEDRYANRKARVWRDPEGVLRAWMEFDDESAALVEGTIRAGMSPRRGGPRFIDKTKAAQAKALVDDPRTDEQLVFDLLIAAIKAGTLADPSITLGGQQHGLRVIVHKDGLSPKDSAGDSAGAPTGIGYLEDTGEAVAPAMIERMLCDSGVTEITVDGDQNPLNVGREHRLFTAKQRVALAIRDGGCMAPDCPYPPSMTEAHHIVEWHSHHGTTDLADGILLCRFDHMRVHNQGWIITRDGGQYWMVPPVSIDAEQRPILLRSKAPWRQSLAS